MEVNAIAHIPISTLFLHSDCSKLTKKHFFDFRYLLLRGRTFPLMNTLVPLGFVDGASYPSYSFFLSIPMYRSSNHDNCGKTRRQLDLPDLRYVQCRTLKETTKKIMHITFLNCVVVNICVYFLAPRDGNLARPVDLITRLSSSRTLDRQVVPLGRTAHNC